MKWQGHRQVEQKPSIFKDLLKIINCTKKAFLVIAIQKSFKTKTFLKFCSKNEACILNYCKTNFFNKEM